MKSYLANDMRVALKAVAHEIAQAAQQLLSELIAERSALVANDTAALDAAGAAKERSLHCLEALEVERNQLISQFTDNPREQKAPSMSTMEHALAGETETLTSWHDTLGVLVHCHTFNQANGAIVAMRLRQCGHLLELLTGTPNNTDLVYGSKGNRAISHPFHTLAKV